MRLVYGKKQNYLSWEDCSGVGLTGFTNYQSSDYRNFAVCMCLFLKRNCIIKQCDNYKYEICAFLRSYAVVIGCFLEMFWDNQLVPSLRVKQLTLEVGTGRRTVVIVTVGDVRQVPY
jgi:hypothetical protein